MDAYRNATEFAELTSIGLTSRISALKTPFALVTIEPAVPVRRPRAQRFWDFWAGLYASDSRPTTAAL